MIMRSRKSASPHRHDRGYILITLILFVALIAVAAMVMVPAIAFQVKRDREEELIHRGVQYSRAMKHFVKKFGRYPTRIEELENTNQIRFLRRRYKDPFTGKDFKILRMSDVQLAFGAGIAGAIPPTGLSPGAAGAPGAPGAPGANGPNGGPAANTMALAGGLAAATSPNPANQNAGTNTTGSSDTPADSSDDNTGDDQTDAGPKPSTTHAAAGPGAPGTFGAVGQGTPSMGAQVFGGGPMVGVASTSKEKSIRVFNKKDHYNQWQFIYDPNSDRGGLLTTPAQSAMQGGTNLGQPVTPGPPGIPGAPNTGVGQPPGQPGMQTPQMPPDQEQ